VLKYVLDRFLVKSLFLPDTYFDENLPRGKKEQWNDACASAPVCGEELRVERKGVNLC
jgi:hypothetical protein